METNDANQTGGNEPKSFTSFKDFRKPTLSETYENLNRVIRDKEFQKSESFKQLVLSDSPLPPFEESLRLSVVDSLQLEDEVVRVLLSQNDIQIKRILRCNWFFRSLPLEFCKRELFPHISFSLRCKIITKLSKHLVSEDEAEKYFLFVRGQYTAQRADYLLPKCSSQFILSHFERHPCLFEYPAGNRILLNICRRYPEVGMHMVTRILELKQHYDIYKIKNVLFYMAGNHTDLFVPFVRNHSLTRYETFGRKLTVKLGRRLREHLFPDFENMPAFKSEVLFCDLPFEDKAKFLARIVRSWRKAFSLYCWTTCSQEICEFLKLMKPTNRLPLIEATFKLLYNLNFNDNSKCWHSSILALLPLETRLPFVKELDKFFDGDRTTFENNVNDSFSIGSPESFVYLYDFDTAFVRLKEILRNSPQPSKRQKVLCHMVDNCKINSDVKGLQEVVDFVTARHRNDDSTVLYSFIDSICDAFPWSTLSSDVFEKLEDLITFCTLKGNPDPHVYMKWKERHIYRLMENGEDVSAHVRDFLENVVVKTCYYRFIQSYECHHSRRLLLTVGEMAVNWIRNSSSEQEGDVLLSCLLQTCMDFGKAHKGSRIMGEVPGLEELLKEKAKGKLEDLGADRWPLGVWEKYRSEVFSARTKPECLLYVLKRRPDLVESRLESFLGCLVSFYSKQWKSLFNFVVRMASFFGKREQLEEFLLSEFRTGKSTENRETALVLYSQVSTIEEFTKIVEAYLPKQEQVEKGTAHDFGRMQLKVPVLIRNVRPRWKNFDLILKFFMGDFLKNVMPSLYSCCHHTRVDTVIPFLKERLASLPRRVSYQKDIIKLVAKLCNRDERSAFCARCWDDFEHYSIRTILFLFISEQFIEEPTPESFRLLRKCILESDSHCIERRPGLDKIPDEFYEEYISALFRFSERQPPSHRTIFQQTFVSQIQRNKVSLLSSEFCEKIIKSNLFNPDSGIEVGEFASYYLMADPEAMKARVLMVLALIEETKASSKSVSQFLHVVLRNSDASYPDILTIVLDNWPKFPLGVLYQEQLLFTYTSLHRKVLREGRGSEFAKELAEFFSGVENLRDLVVVYADVLHSVLEGLDVLEAIVTVKELIMGSRDKTMVILGILALPEEAVHWFRRKEDVFIESVEKGKTELNELVNALEGYGDEVVEIYTRRKFFGRAC